LQALAALSKQFDYIIWLRTAGIGRGLMTETELHEIHDHLKQEVENAVKDRSVYYAPSVDRNHRQRKPNTGMALEAQEEFPDIDFAQSIMVGNNLSDMKFGKAWA